MRVDRIVCIQTQHCMAVTSSEIATAVLELRSAALTLIAVVLKTTDLDALAHELEQRAVLMPGLFDDEPVAIDLMHQRLIDRLEFVLVVHLREGAGPGAGVRGLRVVAFAMLELHLGQLDELRLASERAARVVQRFGQ